MDLEPILSQVSSNDAASHADERAVVQDDAVTLPNGDRASTFDVPRMDLRSLEEAMAVGPHDGEAAASDGEEIAQTDDEWSAEHLQFWRSPIRLQAAAYLYGLETIPLVRARVLELGCGAGVNLLPFAAAYPHATVLGIDPNAGAIELAQQRARGLASDNLRFQCTDLESIDAGLGQFDYIIAHGIFGRSAPSTTEALLRICKENLTPKGIAFVSYNTYPGWKAGEVLRDAMSLHTRTATNDAELLGSARAAINLLFKESVTDRPMNAAVREMAYKAMALDDAELAADYFVSPKAGWYFLEFADAVSEAGLAYVGDARPEQEIPASFSNAVSLNHSLATIGEPKLMRQQYLDFMVGRESRGSLLVHAERSSEILVAPDTARLESMRYAGNFERVAPGTGPSAFRSDTGHVVDTTDSAVLALMELLSDVWPRSMDFAAVLAHPATKACLLDDGGQKSLALAALATLLRAGALHYCKDAGPYDEIQAKRFQFVPGLPERVAQSAAPARQKLWYFNLWGGSVALELDGPARFLLSSDAQFDSVKDIRSALTTAIEKGQLTLPAALADSAEAKAAQIGDLVFPAIDGYRKAGVVYASASLWKDYLIDALQTVGAQVSTWLPYLGPLVQYASAARKSKPSHGPRGKHIPGTATPQVAKLAFEKFEQLIQVDDIDAAVVCSREITERFPKLILGWNYLGTALMRRGEYTEACRILRKALTLDPLHALTHVKLGLALHRTGDLENAEICMRRAITLNPDAFIGHSYLGCLMWAQRRAREAEVCFKHAARLAPHIYENLNNLALTLTARGDLEGAIEAYRQSWNNRPDLIGTYSSLLFVLSHYEDISAEDLFEEHRTHGRRLLAKAKGAKWDFPARKNNLDSSRRLRLGFVSGDLYNHAVSNFLMPIWNSLDKDQFEICAYYNDTRSDPITERLKRLTSRWRNVASLTDAELAKRIYDDEVDILFDLSGHSGMQRLLTFAMKPAPLTVNWIGHPSTTGLPNMDYRMIDRFVAAPGEIDGQFTENLIHLAAAAPFAPSSSAPDISPLPALKNGYITFGSFNRFSKISNSTLDTWISILKALPTSRLLLGASPGGEGQREMLERLTAKGISEERLLFRGNVAMKHYMALHGELDIMLDTYPFTGLTVTCNAMFMGVPTLTLRGATQASRQGAGVMGHLGLPEFIADSREDWIAKAVGWADRLDELAAIRASMRDRFENSDMRSNGQPVTRSLEAALRIMWRRHCDGLPPEPFTSPI